MSQIKDLTGQKFGRLTVLKLSKERIKNTVTWVCKCDCGNIRLVRRSLLTGGNTNSCGCLRRELMHKKCKNNYGKYRKNLKGKIFGRLTVIEHVGHIKNDKRCFWKCRCDCGNITNVTPNDLSSGQTKSCGCLRKEKIKEANTIHGMSCEKEYYCYYDMKTNCYNENTKLYKYYGGMGIKVCEEWIESFDKFYEDIQKLASDLTPEIADRLDQYRRNQQISIPEIVTMVDGGRGPVGTVTIAIESFLRHTDNFREAVADAINNDGDSDNNS